jgi:Tfp pilus assembly protein PilX
MSRARGMALVIGLLLMAALSLLALTASSGMVLQRQMAGNFRDNALALREAGFAENEAEAWLFSRADSERERGCSAGCLLPPGIVPAESLPERPEFASGAWWQAHGFPAGFNPVSGEQRAYPSEGAEPPRWVVAEAHFEPTGDVPGELTAAGLAYYRIFSRGLGRQPGSIAVSETVVARPWEGEYKAGEYPPTSGASSFCTQFAGLYPCGRLAWRRRR